MKMQLLIVVLFSLLAACQQEKAKEEPSGVQESVEQMTSAAPVKEKPSHMKQEPLAAEEQVSQPLAEEVAVLTEESMPESMQKTENIDQAALDLKTHAEKMITNDETKTAGETTDVVAAPAVTGKPSATHVSKTVPTAESVIQREVASIAEPVAQQDAMPMPEPVTQVPEVAVVPVPGQVEEPAVVLGDAIKGEKVSKRCRACHTFNQGGKNKVGPNLFGIVGRKQGAVAGFRYGSYLSSVGGIWDEEKLYAWVADSKGVAKAAAKKTKMPTQKITGVKADDLIAYLKTLQ